MGLILWIDQNTFASNLLEKVFKKKDLPFYTVNSGKDFSYLVLDLKPVMIVLDVETAENSLLELKKQVEETPELKALPFVTIGESQELGFLNVVGTIPRSFDPYKIPEVLNQFRP